jgi:transcriptional regulator with XRE-family HTH domain
MGRDEGTDNAGTTPDRAFGRALRAVRLERGLSQETLAFEAGYDRSYVSLLEHGHYSPSLIAIFRLARALRVRPSALLVLTEEAVETVPDRE